MKRIVAFGAAAVIGGLFIGLVPLEAARRKPSHTPVAHPKHGKVHGRKTPKNDRKPAHFR